jgi:hypothetical protein
VYIENQDRRQQRKNQIGRIIIIKVTRIKEEERRAR